MGRKIKLHSDGNSQFPVRHLHLEKHPRDTATLHPDEWQFHRMPQSQAEAAWCWEVERQAGSGAIPWLQLTDSERGVVLQYFERGKAGAASFKHVPADYIRCFTTEIAWFNEIHEGCGDQVRRHVVEINWGASLRSIREAFEAFLKTEAKERHSGGRPFEHRSGLIHLAVLRVHQAGERSSWALRRFGPLFEWAECEGETIADSKHWKATCETAMGWTQARGHFPITSSLRSHPSLPIVYRRME